MARTPTPVGNITPAADTSPTPPGDNSQTNASTDQGASDAEEEEVGTVEVRVLLDHGKHKPNDVALLTEAGAKAAAVAGWADNHPDAVAYAKSLLN